jgi:CubicO group peptidase (beta-lactamase class C family)
MVLRHGTVVAEGWREPYRSDAVHDLYSLTKGFTSTAIGFAQSEGLLSVDDLVLDHLRDLAPEQPDPHLARMRLRHLLTMTTGHEEGIHQTLFATDDWERAILALVVAHEPGTHFAYSSAATYLLSVILHRRTGLRMLDYLAPRLLEPLGIEGATCEQSPTGVDNGGFGMQAATEDIACLGQLYLDGGRWHGRQLLPEGWAEEATRRQTVSRLGGVDWDQGYGYQFWRCRHDAVRADGAFGQFAVMMPAQDAVVAITSGTSDLQGVLDRVWEHLLPAMETEDDAADGLASDEVVAAEQALAGRLDQLRFAPPAGAAGDPTGILTGRTIDLAPSIDAEPGQRSGGFTAVTIGRFGEPGRPGVVHLHVGGRTEDLPLGFDDWARGVLTSRGAPRPVAVAGAWTAPDTYVAQVRWCEGPSCLTVRATLDGSDVRATATLGATFYGPADLGDLSGVVR